MLLVSYAQDVGCSQEKGTLSRRGTLMPESRFFVGNVEIVGLTDI